MGGPLRCCGLLWPPLVRPLAGFWCLWTWLPLQWENPGAGWSTLTPVASEETCETEGPVGVEDPSTSGLPFSATVWGESQVSGSKRKRFGICKFHKWSLSTFPSTRTENSSHLVDMDEKTVGLHFRVDDSTFRPLPLQQLLELNPLLPEARTDRCLVHLRAQV